MSDVSQTRRAVNDRNNPVLTSCLNSVLCSEDIETSRATAYTMALQADREKDIETYRAAMSVHAVGRWLQTGNPAWKRMADIAAGGTDP